MKFNNKVEYFIEGEDSLLTYVAHDAAQVILRDNNSGLLKTLEHKDAEVSLRVSLPPMAERVQKFYTAMDKAVTSGRGYGSPCSDVIARNLKNNHLCIADMGNGYVREEVG